MSNIENQIHHYTFALYSIYEEKNVSFVDDLTLLFDSLYSNKDIIEIISSNNINKKERKKIIETIFKNNLDELIINFMCILVDNNFFSKILFILQDFFKYYNNQQNILYVKIISAFEMSSNQINKIIESLKKKWNKEIFHILTIDKSLVGGFKIVCDENIVLDYSIKGKLNKLKSEIKNCKGDI